MPSRLLAAAMTTALALLAGCQTLTTQGYLVPQKRDNAAFECPATNCFVLVDPSKSQWVSEYVRANRGGVFHLWLPEGWEFDRTPITFKSEAGARALDCHGQAPRIVPCRLTDQAESDVKYGYTIHVKSKPAYDPFVWPR